MEVDFADLLEVEHIHDGEGAVVAEDGDVLSLGVVAERGRVEADDRVEGRDGGFSEGDGDYGEDEGVVELQDGCLL